MIARIRNFLDRRSAGRRLKNGAKVKRMAAHIAQSDSAAVKRMKQYCRSLESQLRLRSEQLERKDDEIKSLELDAKEADRRLSEADHEIQTLSRSLDLAKMEISSLTDIIGRDRARIEAETARYVRSAEGVDQQFEHRDQLDRFGP